MESFWQSASCSRFCFFFCYKFLVIFRRQEPVNSVAAQHSVLQNYVKLACLWRVRFSFICHLLHHLPLHSPRGAKASCTPRQQCHEEMDGGPPWAQTHESSSQHSTVSQVLDQHYVWCTRSGFSVFSDGKQRRCIWYSWCWQNKMHTAAWM